MKREAQVGTVAIKCIHIRCVLALLFICTCSGNEEVSVVCHKHTAAIAGCAGPGKSMC